MTKGRMIEHGKVNDDEVVVNKREKLTDMLNNEIEDIMKSMGVSQPWWSEKIAMELYEKWWWLKK